MTEISRDDIVYSGGVIAVLVIMAVGFFAGFMFSNLDDTNELSALRLELDLNAEYDRGLNDGYSISRANIIQGIYFSIGQRGFVDVSDLNSTLRLVPQSACQQELEAIVAECNSRRGRCE